MIAVGGDNDVPVVSMSNSVSSSNQVNRRSARGFICHAPTINEPDEYGRPTDKGSEIVYKETKESGLLYQDKSEPRYLAIVKMERGTRESCCEKHVSYPPGRPCINNGLCIQGCRRSTIRDQRHYSREVATWCRWD